MVLHLDEFEAWVTIEGQKTEEYQCTKSASVLQCYIPSQAGKKFQVHWKDTKRTTATDGFLLIDGFKCPGQTISDNPDKPNQACKIGMRTDDSTIKPFKFAQIRLTDDDTRADPDGANGELGQIDLMLFRVKIKHNEEYVSRSAPKPQVVHERAKKGIQHQTVFGKSIKESTPKKAVRLQQLSKDAIARFRFFYRPIEMLRAKGIAPPLEQTLVFPETNIEVAATTLRTETEQKAIVAETKPNITSNPEIVSEAKVACEPHPASEPVCPRDISLPVWEPLSSFDIKEEESEIEQQSITSVPSSSSSLTVPLPPLKSEPDEKKPFSSTNDAAAAELTINRQNRRRDRKPNHNIRVAGTSATDPIVIDDDDDEVDLRSSFPPIPSSSGFTSAQPQSRVVEGKSSGDDDGTVALTSARRHNKKRKRSPVPDSIAHPEASMEKSKPLTKRHKVSNGSMSEKSASSSAIAPASQLDDVIDVDKEEEEGRSIRLREISTLRARLGILEAEQAEHNERRLGRKGKIKLEPRLDYPTRAS